MEKKMIKITFPDGVVEEFEAGTKVWEVAKYLGRGLLLAAAGGLLNNNVVDLDYPIDKDCFLKIITLDSPVGMIIYRRSAAYVFSMAIKNLYGIDTKILVGPHIEKGYYFDILTDKEITEKDAENIREEMQRLIDQDIHFEKKLIEKNEAKKIFEDKPEISKLIEGMEDEKVNIYQQLEGGFVDLYLGPILPKTSYIKAFDILFYPPGVILQFPDYENRVLIMPKRPRQIKLSKVFKETRQWYKDLGVENIAQLNEVIENNKISELIKISEALHEKRIAHIADEIAKRKDKIKFITIAGPSSSGKTTFAKRLSIQLRVNGITPVALGLDDYFVDRQYTPRDENGDYDFEAVEALDLKLLGEHFQTLLDGGEIDVPKFDFETGLKSFGHHFLKLEPGQVLLIEGIHGLNERLTEVVPAENKFKIYISALTQLRIDYLNRIATTDSRLVRRLVRDYQYRNYSASDTLSRWPSVRRGEERNIFPFQENADIMFNSALIYELAVLKKLALPMLKEVKDNDKTYPMAQRLISFLSMFKDCPEIDIPKVSLLREFVGGSGFNY